MRERLQRNFRRIIERYEKMRMSSQRKRYR
jgi:hypothetical protein